MTSSGVDAVDCKANANVKLGKQLRHGGWKADLNWKL